METENQQSQETAFQVLLAMLQFKPVASRPDAVWGIFSLSSSVMLFLLPLALSFWAISISFEGGKIMLPSSPLSWLFFVFAIIVFLLWIYSVYFVLRLGLKWFKIHPLKDTPININQNSIDTISKRVNDSVIKTNEPLVNSINELIREIRKDRDERNKQSK